MFIKYKMSTVDKGDKGLDNHQASQKQIVTMM